MNFIPEGDLYRLIVRSTPEAERFERWVFDEYCLPLGNLGCMPLTLIDDILNNPDLGIKLFTQYKEAKEKADSWNWKRPSRSK